MRYAKRMAPYLRAVSEGMLFIGFSIQIVLGICWMCCNFGQVQGFGEPDSALYAGIFRLLGEKPAVMYLLQLSAAFLAGYLFLQKLWPAGKGFAVWRCLALLTFPFAMQCHLALQPYSLMGTFFLLMLAALLKIDKRHAVSLSAVAIACAALAVALSGVADADRREGAGYSFEGALASRFAWPTLWSDLGRYGEELFVIAQPVAWEASLSPDNMKLLQETLESQVGREAAGTYYLQMAETGWEYHAPMVVRQMGWDALGYAVTPVVFQLQMAGKGYDSYSGRNYEVMRENAPVLTGNYVDYGCWWFGWALILCLLSVSAGKLRQEGGREGDEERKALRKKRAVSVAICVLASGFLVAALTMRGAGKMDYRETIAVNELWLAGPLLLVGGKRRKGI